MYFQKKADTNNTTQQVYCKGQISDNSYFG